MNKKECDLMFFNNLFTTMIGKPKWKIEFEENIIEIEMKTGLTREELVRVANVLEEMRIIKP
ncbi:hypothetical protein [Paenibacillus ferrarius]|uniref:hypothetical protein n=1 Tax=Paenibacillus ferrarius TaxID=1469647 RepID=UPI0011804F41|nr:hypothetical protein [Paenibacillus ferrarius]